MTADPVRWIRFNLVGIMGFVLQTTLLSLLVKTAGLGTAPAVTLAVLAAVSHNFFWHEHFTWPNLPRDRRLKRWLAFHVSTGFVSVLGNLGVTLVLMKVTPLSVVASNAIAVAVVSMVNFLVSDRVIFKMPDAQSMPNAQCPMPKMGKKRLGIEH